MKCHASQMAFNTSMMEHDDTDVREHFTMVFSSSRSPASSSSTTPTTATATAASVPSAFSPALGFWFFLLYWLRQGGLGCIGATVGCFRLASSPSAVADES